MPRGQKIPTAVPQFGHLEKRPTSANWYMVYRPAPGARRIVKPTGTPDQQTAYDMLRDLAGKYARGEMGRHESPTRVTFNTLFDLLVADYSKRGRATTEDMRQRVAKHLRPWFGSIRVIELRKRDIERFVASRLEGYEHDGETETLTPASVNKLLAYLQHAMNLGAKEDPPLVLRVPRWFDRLSGEQERTGTITDSQYQALKESMPPHAALALCIAYHTGMRRGLILSLRWDWVDSRAGVIRIPPDVDNRREKRKPRNVPIYGEMGAMLEMARSVARTPYCIEFEGKPVESLKTAWRTACRFCGVPEMHFHDTRRTAATNAILAGVPEIEIMEMCGWKTPAMLRRYAQGVESRAQNTGRKMQEHFERLRANSAPQNISYKPS